MTSPKPGFDAFFLRWYEPVARVTANAYSEDATARRAVRRGFAELYRLWGKLGSDHDRLILVAKVAVRAACRGTTRRPAVDSRIRGGVRSSTPDVDTLSRTARLDRLRTSLGSVLGLGTADIDEVVGAPSAIDHEAATAGQTGPVTERAALSPRSTATSARLEGELDRAVRSGRWRRLVIGTVILVPFLVLLALEAHVGHL